MDFGSDDLNWWIEQERLAKQQELETQVNFVKEEINTDIAENLENKNLEDDALAIQEYLDYFHFHLPQKHTIRNRKTYERRNKLRKENNLPTKRGSRGNKKMSPDKYYDYCKQVENLESILESKLDLLLENGNIIELFKSYGIELKETYFNYKGFCPRHKEKTASFSISKSKAVCKCYGCGYGNQILRYIFVRMFGEGVDYNLKRLNKIKDEILPYLKLPPINHFDKNGNPTERAYESIKLPTKINQAKLRKDIQNIITKINALSENKTIFGRFEVSKINGSLFRIFCGKNCVFEISNETMNKLDLGTLGEEIVSNVHQQVEMAKRNIETLRTGDTSSHNSLPF